MEDEKTFHDERRTGIGGSDAASILKMNPYNSPLQVYMQKIGELEPNIDNNYTRYGKKIEKIIVEYFEEETGLKVNRDICSNLFRHKKYPFLIGHIDGFIDSEDSGFEAKSCDVRSNSFEDSVPNYYIVQCQHYMNVLDKKQWYVAALKGVEFKYYKIYRDQEFIDYMEKAEIEFWNENVLKLKPPIAWHNDKEAIDTSLDKKELSEETIILPDYFIEKIDMRETLKRRSENDKENLNTIDNMIRQAIGNSQLAVCGNYKISYKRNKNGQRTLLIK